MFQDVEKILFDEAVLAKRIGELGRNLKRLCK